MKSFLPLVCLFGLLGCLPENQIAPKSAVNKDGMICTTERPTGSGVSKRVCRTPEQIAAEESASQRMIGQNGRSGGGTGGGTR